MGLNHFKIARGATLASQGSAPSSPIDGDMYYDSSAGFQFRQSGVWKSVGSSGGGGSSLIWSNESQLNPSPSYSSEFGERVYLFSSGASQVLETMIKVPSTYTSGSPVKIKIAHYSPSTSNTILLNAVSYLIRKGTDAVGSTTNSRTTTNSAITNTSPSNLYQEAVLDITDSTGKINSVSVGAGDIIRISLQRGSDSDTADIRFVQAACEVTFT